MNVRAATAQDAAGVVALHKSANPYGDWYRDPVQRLGRVAYEDLTPLERYLHGGFWMDLSLFRRHFHEYQRRGFPVLVAEERGHLVGECEVWLDEEPPPFGRYAEVAVVASGSPPNADVERDLVTRAAERARKLGYGAIDLSPGHSGGGRVAEGLGFVPLWDTRTYKAKVADVPRSEEEFTTRFLAGGFDALRNRPQTRRLPSGNVWARVRRQRIEGARFRGWRYPGSLAPVDVLARSRRAADVSFRLRDRERLRGNFLLLCGQERADDGRERVD